MRSCSYLSNLLNCSRVYNFAAEYTFNLQNIACWRLVGVGVEVLQSPLRVIQLSGVPNDDHTGGVQ